MDLAIAEAKKAAAKGDIPVGCVIVKDGNVIARGRNMRERKQNAILHAEIAAIKKACRKLHSWRLCDCEMYVTLEPCQMCMGAIINARMKKVIFGTKTTTDLNWRTETEDAENLECRSILMDFFKQKR
jgi:tRNA(adenine34) deaminase